MRVHLFVAATLLLGGCATGQPSGDAAQVARSGDARLTCHQIADEAATLSERMGGTPTGGALGGVAKAGAAALIPGAGLVMAGVDALNAPRRERREADENRWHYLNGLYTARNCLQTAAR
ncbi:hypothetical protein [Brevundimonas sp.]|uniref:hypothetical protein n=1 Tax=Brevundimonas sp. TaxID=1871086 RepID=UPI002ED9A374